jgi:predicted nuclease with TOPRIM domain
MIKKILIGSILFVVVGFLSIVTIALLNPTETIKEQNERVCNSFFETYLPSQNLIDNKGRLNSVIKQANECLKLDSKKYSKLNEFLPLWKDDLKKYEKGVELYKECKKLYGEDDQLLILKYIKSMTNDPSSIEILQCDRSCSNEGWRFTCVFRGKNAFGASVINKGTFILNNEIVIKEK